MGFAQFLIKFLIVIGSPNFLAFSVAHAQNAQQIKRDDLERREYMVVISRQLGVTCTACHDTKNFSADDKKEFRISKEHMKITQSLIDAGFDGTKGKPKADCFMCHRGQLVPDYREKFDPMTMEKGIKRIRLNPSPAPSTQPLVDEKKTDTEDEK